MTAADVLTGRATWAVEQGDALTVLRSLPDGCVQCCVTSPPFYGLRDYGTATWVGGDEGCTHAKVLDAGAAVATSTLGGGKKTTGGHQQEGFKGVCGRCGAVRVDQQIGLEPTPGEYVAKMVAVFREVRRVLHPTGVCWANWGDSYASSPRGNTAPGGGNLTNSNIGSPVEMARWEGARNRPDKSKLDGLKQKDLIGIPWRVAFALQADGWWLRSDVIWAKQNPMPESVTDRPTRSHEYLFLLTKSARYAYDGDAIREEGVEPDRERLDRIGGANGHTVRHSVGGMIGGSATRNKRSVWTIPTAPYAEAHFATFPPALVEPCVLAGCPVGGLVLDPFAGSGTSLVVALRHGRRGIGIELSPAYVALARNRILVDCPMFNQPEAAS